MKIIGTEERLDNKNFREIFIVYVYALLGQGH